MTSKHMQRHYPSKQSKRHPLWIAIAMAAGAISTYPVFAEEEAKADNDSGLEEVIVTARKVGESLQEVPVAVTALTEADMESKGISTLTEIQQMSPNTTLQVSRGTNSTLTAYIRGIGQQDPLWGFEPGVGIYVDDVYIARPQGAVLDVYDIERIEVLRGPQGTLYGKNTIGGAVKYVTKKMSGETEFDIGTNIGSFGQQDVKLSGKIAVSEDLYIGTAVAQLTRDGYGENVNDDWDNYNKDVTTGRVSIEYQATDDLSFRYGYDKTMDQSNAKGGYRLTPSIVTLDQPLADVYDTRSGMDPRNDVTTLGHNLTVDYSVNGDWSVKFVAANREGNTYTNIDFDNTEINSLDVPAVYDDEQTTLELQTTYQGENANGVVGVYSYSGKACGAFDVVLGLAGITLENGGCVDTDSKSVYAQGSYNLTDALSFTVGGRYTQDNKQANIYRIIYAGEKYPNDSNAVELATQTDIQDADKTWSRFTPRVGLEYDFGNDVMVYSSYSEGFKSGGFDMRANQSANPEADAPFGPEFVQTIELGLKSQFADDKVRMNLALFQNDYQDMQVTAQRALGQNNFVSQVLNAGRSEATGAELELVAAPIDGLSLTAILGWIDAEFTEFNSFDVATGEPVNLADQWVVSNTPDRTANFTAAYQYPVFGGQLVSNFSWAFRGESHIFETPSALDDSNYWIANASIVYYSADDSWTLGLHGKNLGDEQYRVAGYNFPATFNADGTVAAAGLGGEDSVIGYYSDPRTVQMSLTYRF